jgi:Uncharacterized protein conserved in bacteria
MRIGEKLQILRRLKGFTQEEVASKLNMKRRSYANLENNTTKVDVFRMKQIAKIYGIEVDEIINFDTNTAFDKCFNKNAETFFSVEKLKSNTSCEEREFFIEQIQVLMNSFNEERRAFMEAIVNLKKSIEKNK